MHPMPSIRMMSGRPKLRKSAIGTKKNKTEQHNTTRHQTSGKACKVINLPKMAVKPHKNTQKCKYRYARCFSDMFNF
jgi:hypothetical protein